MKSGIFCGTFDPITLGHIDIIKKASRIFDKIYLAVSVNGSRKTTKSLQNRIQIAKASLQDIECVEVISFSGLLTDLSRAFGCYNLIRGIRNANDFVYENELLNNYRHLEPKIEAFYIIPDANYAHISSSAVREILELGGNIEGYVAKEGLPLILSAYTN